MKRYSLYDVFLVFALILAVATSNSTYSLFLLIVASILELFDLGKSIYKEAHNTNGTGKES